MGELAWYVWSRMGALALDGKGGGEVFCSGWENVHGMFCPWCLCSI